MVYSGAWGKLIHDKNQKSISCHCPFKYLRNGFYLLTVPYLGYLVEGVEDPR